MTNRRDVTVLGEQPSEVVEIISHRPMLSPAAIQAITYDLKMAEQLVSTVLEEGIDYGQTPGVQGKGLWDPGASKIMNAFECYPRHIVLHREETEKVIAWALEATIIHRGTQQIMGAGVGACSTRETKYKYRWVPDPENYGYTRPEIDNLKTRTKDGKMTYRVENPEYGEQVNTIFQMAAKRSETDAAKTLPGVSSALRKLFDPPRSVPGRRTAPAAERAKEPLNDDSPRWTTFWNAIMGLLGDDYEQKAHRMLGVKSMKDWLSSGKSLEEAIRVISLRLSSAQAWDAVTPEDVASFHELEILFNKLTRKQPRDMYRELGVASRNDITITPWEAFQNLKGTFATQEAPKEPTDPEWEKLESAGT